MSLPDNNITNPNPKPTGKDETPTSGGRKTTSSSSSSRPQEPALKCPRCDSSNTKFCYYNNYSLTQPRHFCKTCRRYWTRGGALRSVPIGGGCRKNKKMKSCATFRVSEDPKNASLTPNGLKFFQGLSPAMDFQLGGTTNTALFSTNQFSSFGDIVTTTSATGISCFSLDPSPSTSSVMGFGFPLGGCLNVHKNFESLSSMNQEMHWKLQQQRMAMLFVGENQKENTSVLPCTNAIEPTNEKTQHFLFENLDNSSKIESFGTGTSSRKDAVSTEWFFDNSYAPIAQTPATSSGNLNENSSSWSTGIQAWSDLTRYTALP